MAYRETCRYIVLCDRCGCAAPEGTAGWWTPAIADQAALEAGWVMTTTEHLCPQCQPGEVPEDPSGRDAVPAGHRPGIRPAVGEPSRPDVCWPPSSPAAANSWEESR